MLGAPANGQSIQALELGYSSQGKDAVISAPAGMRLLMHSATAYNGTASAIDLGVGIQRSPSSWKLYQQTTDVTALIQGGSAVNLFDTTSGHGFYLQSSRHFNCLAFNVSQASTGSPVYAATYWNGATFATLPLKYALGFGATGYKYIVFAAPSDWVQGSGGVIASFSGTNAGYTIQIVAATAPTQAVQANACVASKLLAYREQVASKMQLQVSFDVQRPLPLESGESIAPFFSVASTLNQASASYQVSA